MLLFHEDGELRELFANKISSLKHEIITFPSDYLLNASVEDLCNYLEKKYSLVVPELKVEEIYIDNHKEIDIGHGTHYSKGISIKIVLPFEGDMALFFYCPSTFTYTPVSGNVDEGRLIIEIQQLGHNEEAIKLELNKKIELIKYYLQAVERDVNDHNSSLGTLIATQINKRREKLLADSKLVVSLGIPVRRREDSLTTYSLPTLRKKPKFDRPLVKEKGYAPEPTLAMEEYEHILGIIQNMVLVMERSPSAFTTMDEESLRQHFLVQLNGHYEGQATGETFNFEGKTDILIRAEGRNVFIAECKFWKGEKKLLETVDQLLGYLSWRDTKTALLIFNRNKNFTEVLDKIPSSIESHPSFKRKINVDGETTFRYVFGQPNDVNREVILTVLAFDIPSK